MQRHSVLLTKKIDKNKDIHLPIALMALTGCQKQMYKNKSHNRGWSDIGESKRVS